MDFRLARGCTSEALLDHSKRRGVGTGGHRRQDMYRVQSATRARSVLRQLRRTNDAHCKSFKNCDSANRRTVSSRNLERQGDETKMPPYELVEIGQALNDRNVL